MFIFRRVRRVKGGKEGRREREKRRREKEGKRKGKGGKEEGKREKARKREGKGEGKREKAGKRERSTRYSAISERSRKEALDILEFWGASGKKH